MNFLIFLFIGATSGWLAGQTWKGAGFGLIGNIITGIVGGYVGGWLAAKFSIEGGGFIWQILISAAGAWLLLYSISLAKKV